MQNKYTYHSETIFFLELGVLQSSFLVSTDDTTLWLLLETN